MEARFRDESVEKIIRMAKSQSERDYFLFSLLSRRGLRIGTIVGEHSTHHWTNKAGEIVTRVVDLPGIKKQDLRPQEQGIRVFEKGGNERIVVIPKILLDELGDYSKHFRSDERLIPLSERQANRLVKMYSQAVGVEGNAHTHLFRHYFGTKKARETGRDPWKVKSLLGHTDLRPTAKYVDDLTLEEERELV